MGGGSGIEGRAAGELRLIGEGREAEIFEWDEGRVLRLLRDPSARDRAELEAAAMGAAREAGAAAPAAYEVVEVRGRPGIVIDLVGGPDLLGLIARRPWTIGAAGRTLGEVQAGLHEVIAPPAMPETAEVVRARLATADTAPPALVAFALERLERLPGGDRLLHGDLHPANILVGADGPVAIDWTRASRGDPAADVAWTRLLLRLARPHGSSPWVIRRGHAFGRGLIERDYMRTYQRVRGVDIELIDRWEPVVAVARLASDLEGERPELLELLAGAGAPSGSD